MLFLLDCRFAPPFGLTSPAESFKRQRRRPSARQAAQRAARGARVAVSRTYDDRHHRGRARLPQLDARSSAVWLYLPGIAAHVLASLAALRTDGRVPHIYWGQHETYSWNTTDHLPVGFAHRYDRSRTGGRPAVCRNSAELTGTFSFAKGPLFLISASMVSDLIRDRAVQDEARAALAAAATRNLSRTYRVMPFEDAFSGYALATSARGSARARLVTVHTGWTVTAEGWGFQLAPSTLVWHMKLKSQPQRIVQADDWAAGHHCDLLPASLQCHPYDACNGARWTRCEAVYRTSPSTRTPGKTIEQFSVPAGLMERGRARNCSLEHHSDELVDLKHWRKDRVHIRA